MNNEYFKGYKFIYKDKNIDIYESTLLCIYLEKYFKYNRVIASDSADSEILGISRQYVAKKRQHLEQLGYIKCFSQKGKPSELQINEKIINKINEKK